MSKLTENYADKQCGMSIKTDIKKIRTKEIRPRNDIKNGQLIFGNPINRDSSLRKNSLSRNEHRRNPGRTSTLQKYKFGPYPYLI